MGLKHISHLRKEDKAVQTNREHMEGVGSIAAALGKKAGLTAFTELAAVLHDMGKETEAFWDYLEKAVITEEHWDKGKIDHAVAGAYYIFTKYHNGEKYQRMTTEMLSMVIAYHHGGLADFLDLQCRSAFLDRMRKSQDSFHFEEACDNYFKTCYAEQQLDDLFAQAVEEVQSILLATTGLGLKEGLICGLLTKFAYSCLIDADRLDTFCFMQNHKIATVSRREPGWDRYRIKLEEKLMELECSVRTNGTDCSVARLRKQAADDSLRFASRLPGIYRLTVPTGGGKTFSSLRFALEHGRQNGMDHIFYIAPFLTILDQNVKDVREALEIAKDDQDSLLEYHSNIIREEQDERTQLLAERFEAPLVFTTLVQFLNTFYESGTKSIRRLHQFAHSVLIFDEAQAVPFRCIHPFNAAINFLAEVCGSTIILCTATQPELGSTQMPLIARNQGEIIENLDSLFEGLKRVHVVDATKPGEYSMEELGDFVWEKAREEGNGLVILNKKRQAEEIYRDIENRNAELKKEEQFEVYHLSTHMCAQHRLDVLEKIKEALNKHRMVICISTQLIEAGVNISFGCVIRALAGLDSMAQAAGRCNRHGEYGRQKGVYLVNLADEDLSKLPELECGKKETKRILWEFEKFPEFYGDTLLSPKTIEQYFKYYFAGKESLMDFPLKGSHDVSVISLLDENRFCASAYEMNCGKSFELECRQAYKTAAEAFEVIPGGTFAVITDYGEGEDLIANLSGNYSLDVMKLSLKRAQRFTVNIYKWEFEKLAQNGGVEQLCNGAVYALKNGFYSMNLGFCEEGGLMESLIH